MGRGAVASTPFSNSSRTDSAMPAIDPPVPRATSRTRFDGAAIERLESLLFEECLPQGGLSLEAVDWVGKSPPRLKNCCICWS